MDREDPDQYKHPCSEIVSLLIDYRIARYCRMYQKKSCQEDILEGVNMYISHSPKGIPVSILHKSIAGRYRPVRVADGPITVRHRFMWNASWDINEAYYKVCTKIP